MAVHIQIIRGIGEGNCHAIQKKYTRIGRAPGNDLVLDAKEIPETAFLLEKINSVDYIKIHCKESQSAQLNDVFLRKGEEYLWKPGEVLILAACSWLLLETGRIPRELSENSLKQTLVEKDEINEISVVSNNENTDSKIDAAAILKIGVIALCVIGCVVIAITQIIFPSSEETHLEIRTYSEIEKFVDDEVSAGRFHKSIQELLASACWKESWNPQDSLRDYQKLQWILRQKYEEHQDDTSPEEKNLLAFVNSKVLYFQNK